MNVSVDSPKLQLLKHFISVLNFCAHLLIASFDCRSQIIVHVRETHKEPDQKHWWSLSFLERAHKHWRESFFILFIIWVLVFVICLIDRSDKQDRIRQAQ